jgi:hypothetical protein
MELEELTPPKRRAFRRPLFEMKIPRCVRQGSGGASHHADDVGNGDFYSAHEKSGLAA